MDEVKLIAAAQRGRVDAFNDLVLAYQQQVYTVACRIMGDPAAAEDATQEAFISAYRSIKRFRGGSFKSYLMRIVTNACYDEMRRRKRRSSPPIAEMVGEEQDEDTNPALIDESASVEDQIERQETIDLVQAGIEALPPDQRVTLTLRDVQGLSYAEIAEVTGVPVGTCKSRLARARAELRDYLSDRMELVQRELRLIDRDDARDEGTTDGT